MPILNSVRGNQGVLGFNTGKEIPGLQLISSQTFSNVTDVDFVGVFSNDYVQYKIDVSAGSTSGSEPFQLRFLNGSTPLTASNYREQRIEAASTQVEAIRSTGLTSWTLGWRQTDLYNFQTLEIFNPFQTTNASGVGSWTITANGNILSYYYAYGINVTTSFDGFRIRFPNVNGYGSAAVYGYYKGA